MTSAAMQSRRQVFSSGRAWMPLLATVLGVMTAFSAHSGRDALVVVVTAVAGGGLATWAQFIGALFIDRPKFRVPGQSLTWVLRGAGLAGAYLACVPLSGWSLAVWPGAFVVGSQAVNGGMVGTAAYALARYRQRRRSPLQS